MRSCRFGHLFRIAHPTVAATPLSRSTDVDHNKFRIRFRSLTGIPNKALAYMSSREYRASATKIVGASRNLDLYQ